MIYSSIKISIIIPVYNMEKYISDAIENAEKQTLGEMEIICIDDGSTDDSADVIKQYQKKYANIILLEQNNSGSGKARNEGIKAASGEYVTFLDADDFYPRENVLEMVYNEAVAHNAEICGGSGCNYRNGVYTYTGLRKGFVFEENGWISSSEFQAFGGFWRFIYKREFLLEKQITFPDYLRCQDPPFFLSAVAAAGRVYCLAETTYCYRKEHKKVTFNERKACDFAKGIRDSLKIAKENQMEAVYESLTKEIHGELSALIYHFAANGSSEMQRVLGEINQILKEDDRKLLEGSALEAYMANISEEKKIFKEKLKKSPRILIYGAGTIGKKVLEYLKQNGHIPEAFVVSDKTQNPDQVQGLVVKEISEYTAEKEHCMVIIATFSYLHEEIIKTLNKYGFTNVYPIDLEKFYLFQDKIKH